MWEQEMAITEKILHKGHKFETEPRQWHRLLDKLTQKGR
jgi:hypothetical protein